MQKPLSPIGVFDSGYGGLTVMNEIIKVLPEYDYLYLGDNARAPYGTKSFEVVYEHTWECVQELFKRGCDLVILACNTASAKALRSIQQQKLIDYPGKRVLGVIRPSAEMIGTITKAQNIGVFATEGTVKSESYLLEIIRFWPDLKVIQQACPLWVPLIENNAYTNEDGISFILHDVERFLLKNQSIDTIILGCTHYPILLPLLEKHFPSINFISQGKIVADSLKEYLLRHTWLVKMLTTGKTRCYLTTEEATIFKNSVASILHQKVNAKQISI